MISLKRNIPKSSSFVQIPIPPSMATPNVIAPRQRLARPYLTPLTLSCFFLPVFPSTLPFVGDLTILPAYLQARRHRRFPDGFSICLSDKTRFIPNGFNFWRILLYLILRVHRSELERSSTFLVVHGLILSPIC